MTRRRNNNKKPANGEPGGDIASRRENFAAWMAVMGVIVGALLGFGTQFIQHHWNSNAQQKNVRRSIYANFIAQANALQSVMLSTFDVETTAKNTGKANDGPQGLVTDFLKMTSSVRTQFQNAQAQVELIGSSNVVNIAIEIGHELSAYYFDLENVLSNPGPPALADKYRAKSIHDVDAAIKSTASFIKAAKSYVQ